MRALRVTGPGSSRIERVSWPVPRGHQVLLAVSAAGLCQSDLHVLDAPPDGLAARIPFTLGHEVVGTVLSGGEQVTTVQPGEAVAVYGPWGCGECRRCRHGLENYCLARSRLGYAGVGLGRDGGMADAVLVEHERHLAPLAGLDPVQAAPLTDAGLTSLHAIGLIARRLPAHPVLAVIGVGGLGHLAVQLLRATTDATVIAFDTRPEALHLARECGAESTVLVPAAGSAEAAAPAHDSDGVDAGVDAVLDFVGAGTTLALAASMLRPGGDLVVVGSGGGRLVLDKAAATLPPGTRVSLPFWGSRAELDQVLALARAGALRAAVQTFPLAEAARAIECLRAGALRGRAVLLPGQAGSAPEAQQA